MHNGNICIRHFDLLEMDWHRPQTSIVTLMQLSGVVLCKIQFAMSEDTE